MSPAKEDYPGVPTDFTSEIEEEYPAVPTNLAEVSGNDIASSASRLPFTDAGSLSLVSLFKVKSPAEPEIAPYVEEIAPYVEEIAPSVPFGGAETTVPTGQASGPRRPVESTLSVDGYEKMGSFGDETRTVSEIQDHAPTTSMQILVQRDSAEPVTDAMDDIYPRIPQDDLQATAGRSKEPVGADKIISAFKSVGAADDPVANALEERGFSRDQLRLVTSKELSMSSAAFQNRLWSKEWESKLAVAQGFTDYTLQEDWTNESRTVTYKTKTPLSFTAVTSRQHKQHLQNGHTLVLEEAISHNVPYGDHFKVVTLKEIMPVGAIECALHVSIGVVFVKSTIMKGTIEAAAVAHGSKSTEDFAAMVRRLAGEEVSPRAQEMDKTAQNDPDDLHTSLEDESMDAKCMKFAGKPVGFWEKGNISNLITFAIMIIGLVLRVVYADDWGSSEPGAVAGSYFLAFGLFGFAGGVTNWLAVKMLFEDMPAKGKWSLPGSGIIPKQFLQIREAIKRMIMDTFFEHQFLLEQLQVRVDSLMMDPERVKWLLNTIMTAPTFDKVLDAKIAEMGSRSSAAGMMLGLLGLSASTLKPFLRVFVGGMSGDIGKKISKVLKEVGNGKLIGNFRNEVDKLVDGRLREMTPERIKKLVEAVMAKHLGWLVVWGNIFGGLIGVVSVAVGY